MLDDGERAQPGGSAEAGTVGTRVLDERAPPRRLSRGRRGDDRVAR